MISKEGAMMLSSIVILVVCQLRSTCMCISNLCLNLQKQKEKMLGKIKSLITRDKLTNLEVMTDAAILISARRD